MTQCSIVHLGHPALRTPAAPIEKDRLADPELQALIDAMLEAMLEAGGVGLAAPQLGINEQLFVYVEVDPEGEDQSETETRTLINPALEPLSGEMVYEWEGCLSVPELRGLVPRHPAVRVHALDRHGQPLSFRAEGYQARIVQHEYDHLNGVVFLDRMRDLRSLSFREEWEEYMTTKDDTNDDHAD
ncbi:MAG: peptide deformylase [bacterium]|nr:peptide deformylase [bacterium]